MRLIPVRVLVIDDDESLCRKLSAWLTEAAFDVVTFTDPAAGLEYAGKVDCQIALVDLRFPDMDAADLIGLLRRVAPRTWVVALAAFPEAAQVIAAVRAGVRDVLEKPIQEPVLRTALERQLAEMGISVRSEQEYNRRVGIRIRVARPRRT